MTKIFLLTLLLSNFPRQVWNLHLQKTAQLIYVFISQTLSEESTGFLSHSNSSQGNGPKVISLEIQSSASTRQYDFYLPFLRIILRI